MAETVVQRCSVIKVFWACILIKKQSLKQVFCCEFCEIFKKTFSRRTSLVAASDVNLYFVEYFGNHGNYRLDSTFSSSLLSEKININFLRSNIVLIQKRENFNLK